MLYITIFCSARDLEEKYTKPVQHFVYLLVKNGFGVVWGGTDKGLMKVVADTVKKEGGKLIGVSIPFFQEWARKDADEMFIAKNLAERKLLMLAKGVAIVTLVGGLGTLDEITEIIELKRIEEHQKPIIILNTENYYEGLKLQLQKMKDDGFLHLPLENMIYFADQPEEVLTYLKENLPENT